MMDRLRRLWRAFRHPGELCSLRRQVAALTEKNANLRAAHSEQWLLGMNYEIHRLRGARKDLQAELAEEKHAAEVYCSKMANANDRCAELRAELRAELVMDGAEIIVGGEDELAPAPGIREMILHWREREFLFERRSDHGFRFVQEVTEDQGDGR